MNENITATMTDAEKEFANAVTDGINTAFKRADMKNTIAIGVSSAVTIGGLAITGVGIYTAMKNNMALGTAVAVAGIVTAGIGGYKLVDSVNQKKFSSALIKGMEEYSNMIDNAE